MIKVGQMLYNERVRKGLTIEAVSKVTKIRQNFLSAIEKGDYYKLPSTAYAQGFVRNYVEFLGLPKKETMARFRREFDQDSVYKVLPDGLVRNNDFPMHRLRIQQTAIALFSLFLLLLGYILFQYRYAFLNPPVSIDQPKEGAVVKQGTVTITGNTDANATLYVNSAAVSLDKDGRFKKEVDVFPGETVISVKAVNRFGKETVVERHIQVK